MFHLNIRSLNAGRFSGVGSAAECGGLQRSGESLHTDMQHTPRCRDKAPTRSYHTRGHHTRRAQTRLYMCWNAPVHTLSLLLALDFFVCSIWLSCSHCTVLCLCRSAPTQRVYDAAHTYIAPGWKPRPATLLRRGRMRKLIPGSQVHEKPIVRGSTGSRSQSAVAVITFAAARQCVCVWCARRMTHARTHARACVRRAPVP